MTAENLVDLRRNTRIGFTAKRGTAWHYRVGDPDSAANHYEGPVPVDAVLELFSWELLSAPLRVQMPEAWVPPPVEIEAGIYVDNPYGRLQPVPGRQAIVRADTGAVLGVFMDGYEIHQYRDWLLGQVANLLDDTVNIGSAGLLRGGAQAWVSVEVPDNITTPEGVVFRPNLLACTSCDGSLATTYKRVVTHVVCDNTQAAALGETGQQLKIKHSRYSKLRLAEARDALNLIYTIADDFAAEVAGLCQVTVTDRQWADFVDAHAPLTGKDGEEKKGRAFTLAKTERDALYQLWRNDNRVTPWKNTAFGVMQAVSTYTHHMQPVRSVARAERNMSNAITGKATASDIDTVSELLAVLAQ